MVAAAVVAEDGALCGLWVLVDVRCRRRAEEGGGFPHSVVYHVMSRAPSLLAWGRDGVWPTTIETLQADSQ